MKTQYFVTPNGQNVSCIGKNGSTAIGKAILEQFYPEKIPTMIGADPSNSPGWQAFVPKVQDPDSAIVVVRDPVERFRSAVSQIRRVDQVDEILTEIENGERIATNYHFFPAINYTVQNSILFKFPEHINEIADEIGLSDIPSVNDNSNNPPKPDLTQEQLTRVQAIYADDIALFDSIVEAAQSYSAPPRPEPLAQISDKNIKLRMFQRERDKEYQSNLLTSFGLTFKADLETIIDIQTIIAILPDGATYQNYKTANGEYHDITKEQFQLAVQEGIQRKSAAFAKEYALSQQVQNASLKSELDAIVW